MSAQTAWNRFTNGNRRHRHETVQHPPHSHYLKRKGDMGGGDGSCFNHRTQARLPITSDVAKAMVTTDSVSPFIYPSSISPSLGTNGLNCKYVLIGVPGIILPLNSLADWVLVLTEKMFCIYQASLYQFWHSRFGGKKVNMWIPSIT